MLTKRTVIGPKSTVTFVDYGVELVPVKIDTGADSSSLWATNVREKDGVLKFTLFGPSSPWYTGEVIRTNQYRVLSVRNSFGVSELRYKVALRISLNGRTFKARFTLSNRALNRYPILIGRQTLKNRFIVDVAHEEVDNDVVRTLVLTHREGDKFIDKMTESAGKTHQKLQTEVYGFEDIVIFADSEGIRVFVGEIRKDIANYDFVFLKTRVQDAELAAIVAHYAKRHGIAFADKAAILLATDTKIHQISLLAGHDIPLPQTIYMERNKWPKAYGELKNRLGVPFVFKDNSGTRGRNNYLVKSKKQFLEVCEQISNQKLQMVAQQYIPSGGYLRLVVMGNVVAVAMYRKVGAGGSHVYKKDLDGPAEEVNLKALPSKVQHIAIKAARILAIDIAGVDLIQDKNTRMWYCLEVNNSPQLVGGAFVEKKIAALQQFIAEEVGK